MHTTHPSSTIRTYPSYGRLWSVYFRSQLLKLKGLAQPQRECKEKRGSSFLLKPRKLPPHLAAFDIWGEERFVHFHVHVCVNDIMYCMYMCVYARMKIYACVYLCITCLKPRRLHPLPPRRTMGLRKKIHEIRSGDACHTSVGPVLACKPSIHDAYS